MKEPSKPRLTAHMYRSFIRGQSDKAAADDFKMSQQKRARLQNYDKLFKSFQYRAALDAAVTTARPEIVCSVVEELAAHNGLYVALGKLCFLPVASAFSCTVGNCPLLHMRADVSHAADTTAECCQRLSTYCWKGNLPELKLTGRSTVRVLRPVAHVLVE